MSCSTPPQIWLKLPDEPNQESKQIWHKRQMSNNRKFWLCCQMRFAGWKAFQSSSRSSFTTGLMLAPYRRPGCVYNAICVRGREAEGMPDMYRFQCPKDSWHMSPEDIISIAFCFYGSKSMSLLGAAVLQCRCSHTRRFQIQHC